FSSTGRSVISGGNDGKVAQWDLANGGLIQNFRGHAGKVNGIAVSSDGQSFASSSEDDSLRIWSLRTKLPIAKLTLVGFKPSALALINEGRSILASVRGKDGEKKELWGRFLPKIQAKVEVNPERIRALVIELANEQFGIRKAATDELIAMGEKVLPHLEKIDVSDPEVSARLEGVREMILGQGGGNAIKVSHAFKDTLKMVCGDPTGRYWAGITGDGKSAKIVLGEVIEEKIVLIEEVASERHPESIAFSADGRTLVAANGDGTMTIYSIEDRE
ncbi:hypothetical protein N9A86_00345, partial [Akkermansiaceae bacterium]|nr:hypothetical protein [Akkermansiaceae bacterium]